MKGDWVLIKIFEFTTEGDYTVVEFEGGVRFRLTGMQRAADGSTLKGRLEGAQLQQDFIDVTTPFDGRKLPKISSTVFVPDSGKYHVQTENGDSFELSADEAFTMLRPDEVP